MKCDGPLCVRGAACSIEGTPGDEGYDEELKATARCRPSCGDSTHDDAVETIVVDDEKVPPARKTTTLDSFFTGVKRKPPSQGERPVNYFGSCGFEG